MPLDDAIKAMSDIGLSYVELWQGHLEPKDKAELKKWRTAPSSLDQMKEVRRKFNNAGIQIYAVNFSFRAEYTDEEVLHGMEMTKLLGDKDHYGFLQGESREAPERPRGEGWCKSRYAQPFQREGPRGVCHS